MSKTLTQIAAAALASLLTLAVFTGTDAMASHQYAAAQDLALVDPQVQTVIVVGHRSANA